MVDFTGDKIDLSVQSVRLARIWQVLRVDGVSKYITDHDKELTFNGQVYSPAHGFQVTTRETTVGSNVLEASGLMDDTVGNPVFSYSDFVVGLYEEAKVFEYVVDWKYLWRPHIRRQIFWFGQARFTESNWAVPLEGPSRFMTRVTGRRVTKLCTLELFKVGDFECNASRTGREYTSTVAQVIQARTSFKTLSFPAGGIPGGLIENRFADGVLIWLTGANAGTKCTVKSSDFTTDGDYTLELYLPLRYDVAVSDTFSIEWGCDRTIEMCGTDFQNEVNHGGEAHTPGPDIGGNIERVKTS